MKIIEETKDYVLVKVPESVCRGAAKTLTDGVKRIMEYYETLENEGLVPMDYVRNIECVMCRKTDQFVG